MEKFNLRAAVPGFTSALQIAILSKEATNLVPSLYIIHCTLYTVHSKEVLMKLKFIYLFSALAALVIIAFGCNKSSPPTQPAPVELKDTVNISVADVTHRSVSVNVQCTMNNVQWSVSLYRIFNGADTLVAKFPVTIKDTTVIDDNDGIGLLINTSYRYYAILTDTAGALKEKTDPITVNTLAPTSHNYTWQEYIIGDDLGISSNVLYDVWGTDENNVWAVGGVQINGTSYGVLHWNGIEWIPDSTAGGYAIYGFNNSDVWTVGGGVFHYDGVKWNRIDGYSSNGQGFPLDSVLFYSMPYTSIWGTSSNNLYLGNQWGKIVHWDGKKASLLNLQGIDVFKDIWGTSESDIYAASGTISGERRSELYHYNGLSWEKIKEASWNPSNNTVIGPISSIWKYPGQNSFFAAGGRVWSITNSVWHEYALGFLAEKIRGNKPNDVFVCGHWGYSAHYNGVDWQIYPQSSTLYNSLWMKNNTVFEVGVYGDKAIIRMGKR